MPRATFAASHASLRTKARKAIDDSQTKAAGLRAKLVELQQAAAAAATAGGAAASGGAAAK